MNAADLVVIGMCLAIVLIGIAVLRMTRRNRAMGIIGIALGTVALVAWFAADDEPPTDPGGTPGLHEPGISNTSASPASGQ